MYLDWALKTIHNLTKYIHSKVVTIMLKQAIFINPWHKNKKDNNSSKAFQTQDDYHFVTEVLAALEVW